MTKETIYIDAVSKLNQQDALINELATALSGISNAYHNNDYELCYSRIEAADIILKKCEEEE
jgi:hypothetical protein